jgi:16S rRNA (cytosine967-C5)-methyltransferase
MNSREKAFLALCAVHKKEGVFLSHFDFSDDPFAREIAYGTERRILTLDAIAKNLAAQGSLKLKLPEKMLLRMGIYQHVFMDKVPPHALVFEMVQLAKKHCYKRFANFLNASLRKLIEGEEFFPSENDLSAFYSFQNFFIEKLLAEYGLEHTKEILEALNKPPRLFARKRNSFECHEILAEDLSKCVNDPAYYIQSRTQMMLMSHLYTNSLKNREFDKEAPQIFCSERVTIAERQGASENEKCEAKTTRSKTDSSSCLCITEKKRITPEKILDLCAAPGGKLITLADFFPKAELFANDVSEVRLRKLKENLSKYGISATISCYDAREFPEQDQFDLILVDVPCSNSGVFNKRPEARWRLNPESLKQLSALQFACLEKASKLLKPGGEIWYLTCSILHDENENMIKKACQELSLAPKETPFKILPNPQNLEGGFAISLKTPQ